MKLPSRQKWHGVAMMAIQVQVLHIWPFCTPTASLPGNRRKGVPLEVRREQEVWARHEGSGQHPWKGITVSSDMNSFITSFVAVDV